METPQILSVPSNVIYLVKQQERWYSISDLAPFALKLLGTNVLATKFSADVEANVVFDYIQKTNPEAFVMVMK